MNLRALLHWPAPERNKAPIADVLRRVLPRTGLVLEVASGTGQHAEHFARLLPELTFQPTDHDPELLEALHARSQQAGLGNLRPPLRLDAGDEAWPLQCADAVFNANMIHIAPWDVALGLLAGAGRVLDAGGVLVTYGPYMLDGEHTSQSNAQFDASLRERDSRWGVRDLGEVAEVAARHGLTLVERVAMPANNFTIVWRKQA